MSSADRLLLQMVVRHARMIYGEQTVRQWVEQCFELGDSSPIGGDSDGDQEKIIAAFTKCMSSQLGATPVVRRQSSPNRFGVTGGIRRHHSPAQKGSHPRSSTGTVEIANWASTCYAVSRTLSALSSPLRIRHEAIQRLSQSLQKDQDIFSKYALSCTDDFFVPLKKLLPILAYQLRGKEKPIVSLLFEVFGRIMEIGGEFMEQFLDDFLPQILVILVVPEVSTFWENGAKLVGSIVSTIRSPKTLCILLHAMKVIDSVPAKISIHKGETKALLVRHSFAILDYISRSQLLRVRYSIDDAFSPLEYILPHPAACSSLTQSDLIRSFRDAVSRKHQVPIEDVVLVASHDSSDVTDEYPTTPAQHPLIEIARTLETEEELKEPAREPPAQPPAESSSRHRSQQNVCCDVLSEMEPLEAHCNSEPQDDSVMVAKVGAYLCNELLPTLLKSSNAVPIPSCQGVLLLYLFFPDMTSGLLVNRFADVSSTITESFSRTGSHPICNTLLFSSELIRLLPPFANCPPEKCPTTLLLEENAPQESGTVHGRLRGGQSVSILEGGYHLQGKPAALSTSDAPPSRRRPSRASACVVYPPLAGRYSAERHADIIN